MGRIGTKAQTLGEKRQESNGRVYQYLYNADTVTRNDGDVVVYYDDTKMSFDQPSTAKLFKVAGVLHNPDFNYDADDASYDVETGEYNWVCIEGPCLAKVEGTVAVAAGDILRPVNALDYFIKDTEVVYEKLSGNVTGACSTSSVIAIPVVNTMSIVAVRGCVGTAPAGAAMIVDVHKNGTTIFTTQANRLTIAAGATEGVSGTPEVTTVEAGDELLVLVDQVGSGTAGSNLGVVIYGYQGRTQTAYEKKADCYAIALEAQASAGVVKTKVLLVRNK